MKPAPGYRFEHPRLGACRVTAALGRGRFGFVAERERAGAGGYAVELETLAAWPSLEPAAERELEPVGGEGEVVYRLPPTFYWDHVSRDLPAGRLVRSTSRHVFVALDVDAYDELVSDARHYSDAEQFAGGGWDGRGVIASARATLRALEQHGRPSTE